MVGSKEYAKKVHPRVSGVLMRWKMPVPPHKGSSPRERGFGADIVFFICHGGFIPA